MADQLPNIRDPEKFFDSMVDWSPLNSCFEGAVQISDVDGIVERNGHVAMYEQKSDGACVPKGQDILLDRVTRQRRCESECCQAPVSPQFTAFIVFGELKSPSEIEVRRSGLSISLDVGLQKVKAIASFWDRCARNDYFRPFDQRMWARANQ
jgi:hypothetical protein